MGPNSSCPHAPLWDSNWHWRCSTCGAEWYAAGGYGAVGYETETEYLGMLAG